MHSKESVIYNIEHSYFPDNTGLWKGYNYVYYTHTLHGYTQMSQHCLGATVVFVSTTTKAQDVGRK